MEPELDLPGAHGRAGVGPGGPALATSSTRSGGPAGGSIPAMPGPGDLQADRAGSNPTPAVPAACSTRPQLGSPP